jgi:prevent-host-death family protein
MSAVNIHEAKTHFSRLVDRAIAGETVVIAKAGHPVAKLVALEGLGDPRPRRTGFLVGRVITPDDFDTMGESEITSDFDGAA